MDMTPEREFVHAALGLIAIDTPNDNLVSLAREHRVTSLTLDALFKSGYGLSEPTVTQLAAIDLQVRHRFSLAEHEVYRLERAAQSAGVQLCIVKGIVNAERWFSEDSASRNASDVDVFVRPSDTRKAEQFVEFLQADHPLASVCGELMSSGDLPDIPITSGKVLIELHANPFSLILSNQALERIWEHTELYQTKSGASIRRLDSATALVQAIINSAKDNHAYLLQIVEISRAIKDPSIDWRAFTDLVVEHRWESIISDALRYVEQVTGVIAPVELGSTWLSRKILKLIAPQDRRLGGLESWRHAQRFCKLDFAVPGSRIAAARGILGRTLSSPQLISAYAPDLTGPYLLRAIRYWWRRQQYVKGKRDTLGKMDD